MKRVILAVVSTLSAVCAAVGLTTLLGQGLAVPQIPIFGAVVEAPEVQVPSEAEYASRILPRNLFGLDILGPGDPPPPGRTAGIRLLGTVVANDVAYSSALIEMEGDRPRGFGLGDALAGGQVVEIRQKEVVLLRDGKRHKIAMTPGDTRPPKSASTAKSSVGKGVDRETLQNLSFEDLSSMGRATPHRGPDGAVDGWRLMGIRRGSIPDAIGIKNGDIVHSVNGQDLDIHAWTSLQDESEFEVSLTRRGQKETVRYTLEE